MNRNLDKLKDAFLGNTVKSTEKRSKRTPFLIFIIVLLLFVGMQQSTSIFSPDPVKDSWGKIILPLPETKITGEFRVIGETQNIKKGHYIWLAFESKSIKECWPQKRVLRNSRFRSALRPLIGQKELALSVYVVNQAIHDQWRKWLNQNPQKGITLPSGMILLDQIDLNLE